MSCASADFAATDRAASITSGSPVAVEPVHGPVLRGHMHLTAAAGADGRTRLARQAFRAPFHLSKPYWNGSALHVQVVNPTAGILEGDRLELDVAVESGASLLVTTPAATRAFMMGGGRAACRQHFAVRAGGWLEYLPEPLFPHRGADYGQATCLQVEAGGEAVFVDTLAPGRVGLGERWAWRRLTVSLDVEYAGEPVLRECLDGGGAEFGAMAAFHGTPDAFVATMVLVTERLAADATVWETVRAMHGGGLWVGATALRRGGWIVRVVAANGQAMRDALGALRSTFASALPRLASDLRRV